MAPSLLASAVGACRQGTCAACPNKPTLLSCPTTHACRYNLEDTSCVQWTHPSVGNIAQVVVATQESSASSSQVSSGEGAAAGSGPASSREEAGASSAVPQNNPASKSTVSLSQEQKDKMMQSKRQALVKQQINKTTLSKQRREEAKQNGIRILQRTGIVGKTRQQQTTSTSTPRGPVALSRTQLEAIEVVRNGGNVFVTGPAGVGKSHLVKSIVEDCEQRLKKVHVVATTGIAAVNIGGTTIHSWGGIGAQRWVRVRVLLCACVGTWSRALGRGGGDPTSQTRLRAHGGCRPPPALPAARAQAWPKTPARYWRNNATTSATSGSGG